RRDEEPGLATPLGADAARARRCRPADPGAVEAPGFLRGRDGADRAARAELPALDRRRPMSAYETIRYDKAGPAATITLNRPEARNGIVARMMDELWEVVQDAGADKSLRVLV